jgi:hypothetical protein
LPNRTTPGAKASNAVAGGRSGPVAVANSLWHDRAMPPPAKRSRSIIDNAFELLETRRHGGATGLLGRCGQRAAARNLTGNRQHHCRWSRTLPHIFM